MPNYNNFKIPVTALYQLATGIRSLMIPFLSGVYVWFARPPSGGKANQV